MLCPKFPIDNLIGLTPHFFKLSVNLYKPIFALFIMKAIKIIAIIIIAVLAVFLVLLFKEDNKPRVCFGDICFNVEVVDTDAEREKGLMFRESLDDDSGMLFIFDSEGNYPFWMKNTLIPLDMIWIDSERKIVYIKENAMPCEEDPCPIINHEGSALYVFEINGGLSSERNITVGNSAEFIGIQNE